MSRMRSSSSDDLWSRPPRFSRFRSFASLFAPRRSWVSYSDSEPGSITTVARRWADFFEAVLEELGGREVHDTDGAWVFTLADVFESNEELPAPVDPVVFVASIAGSPRVTASVAAPWTPEENLSMLGTACEPMVRNWE